MYHLADHSLKLKLSFVVQDSESVSPQALILPYSYDINSFSVSYKSNYLFSMTSRY